MEGILVDKCSKCDKVLDGFRVVSGDLHTCCECAGYPTTEKSVATIKYSNVYLSNDITLPSGFFDKRITEVNINKTTDSTVEVTAVISNNNIDDNYVIADALKDRLFDIFYFHSTRVKFNGFNITPGPTVGFGHLTPSYPPQNAIGSKEIISTNSVIESKEEQISNTLRCIENGKGSDNIIDRFKDLFTAFETISPKNNGSIDYRTLVKNPVVDNILTELTTTDLHYWKARFELFIESNLEDTRANKNYSLLLQEAIENNKKEDMYFCILKCVQIVRNSLQHDFMNKINFQLIVYSYSILYTVFRSLILD